jgi:hypothetical protein
MATADAGATDDGSPPRDRADDGACDNGATKMKTSRKHLFAAAVSLPLALTALTACGSGKDPITMSGTAAPAGVSTTAATTTAAPIASKATDATTPKATAVASRSTAAAKPSTRRGVLSGTRAVVIVPVPSSESVLAIDSDGRLVVTDAEADFFVFTPIGRRFQIGTAGIAANIGEARCLRIKSNGSQSLTVVGAVCDASDDRQLFDVAADGKNFAISNASAFLQVDSDGLLIAQELGDGGLDTTFKLVDNGKVTTPTD